MKLFGLFYHTIFAYMGATTSTQFFVLDLCEYLHVCALGVGHIVVQIHVHMSACGGMKLTLGVFLDLSVFYLLSQYPLLNPELTNSC